MGSDHESGEGVVRITSREIFDEVRLLSGDVRAALEQIPRNEAAHADTHRGYEKRLENHGDRIRDLERVATERAPVAGQVATLTLELAKVKTQQDRAAWIPALIAGLVPTVLGGVTVAFILANFIPAR